MLLGLAIERGLVAGVDVRVLELLGGRQPAAQAGVAKQALTVRELLTMSSCLDCNDWDDSSPGNEELMYPQDDWLQFALDLPVRSSRSFSYCTAGVVMLGIALERTVGEPLSAFAQRELLGPLRIDRAVGSRHPPAKPRPPAGCARRAVPAGARRAVPERRARDRARRLGRRVAPGARSHRRRTSYGYLWWLKSFAGVRSFFMTGMGGNRVHVFRARGGRRDHVRELRPSRRPRAERPALLEQVLPRWQ
jgi:CubicO group peptidase (beta-lactamase class C family)